MARKDKDIDRDRPKVAVIHKYIVHDDEEERRITVEHQTGHDFVEMFIGDHQYPVTFTVAEFEDFIIKCAHVRNIAEGKSDD